MIGCPHCGRENPEGARFCNSCGGAVAAADAVREVRKTVTVLFCDVTGSTALGESSDPEALLANGSAAGRVRVRVRPRRAAFSLAPLRRHKPCSLSPIEIRLPDASISVSESLDQRIFFIFLNYFFFF